MTLIFEVRGSALSEGLKLNDVPVGSSVREGWPMLYCFPLLCIFALVADLSPEFVRSDF